MLKWVDTMLTVDAVKCLALDPESYKQFFESAKVCVMSCMAGTFCLIHDCCFIQPIIESRIFISQLQST